MARNFAWLRGVRLFFSNTVFLKSLKTRFTLKKRLEKKLAIVKKSTLVGFKRKGYSVKAVAKGKTKLKG